jgi:hypothetical protein
VPPTVTSENKFLSEGKEFKLEESPYYFTVESYSNETLNKYKGRKLYNVKTQLFVNQEVVEQDNYLPSCKSKFGSYMMDFYDPICTDISDQSIFKLYNHTLFTRLICSNIKLSK